MLWPMDVARGIFIAETNAQTRSIVGIKIRQALCSPMDVARVIFIAERDAKRNAESNAKCNGKTLALPMGTIR
jgi:hypothetical protein